MILLLYAATAAALLALCHRYVQRISPLAAALLFLLPFCMMGEALLTDRVYAPIDFAYATEPLLPMRGQYGIGVAYNGSLSDVACQMIPWRKAVQWSLAHHVWPLRNPFILSGDILAAAAQPAAYSPFTLIACLLPVGKSFTCTAVMTFFIAALGAFLLARDLGCRESAALLGAAGWMYCADISFFLLWPLGESWALLPLVLLGVRRAVRAPALRSIGLLATAFTLMLLAGHPETALHIVALAAAYAVFAMFRVAQRASAIRFGAAALRLIAAGLLSLLICAVYLLPVIDAVLQSEQHQSRRDIYANQAVGVTAPNVAARLATDVFPFLQLRRWRVPSVNSAGFDTAAVGSIVIALAIYAMWRVRSPETWFFTAMTIFCLLARAQWGPLARAMQKLPLFDVALNERLSFGAAFGLALLAALGVEELLRRERDIGAAITAGIVLVVLTAGTLLLLHAHVVDENAEMWGEYKIGAELAGLAVVSALFIARIPPSWSAAAILGVLLWQRVVSESGIYPTLRADAAYPPVPIFAALRNVATPFRVTGVNLTFIPGTSALYELEDVRGYEAISLRRYGDTFRLWCEGQPVWFNRINDLTRPFLSFLNVRFAVVWPRYPVPDGWRIAATQRGSMLLENARAIDRAFVPARVKLGLPEWEAINEMTRETDFRERAWIEADVAPYERQNGPGRVTSIVERPLAYDLAADMERDGWVLVSESAWRGWRAYIDGRRVAMQIANGAFLSVYVPGGHHRVKLVYKPQSFVVGRVISVLTLAGIAAFIALRRVRR